MATFLGDTTYGPSTATSGLTVTKATLTVTAANAARVYGAPDPVYTAAYSGFVNGDTPITAFAGGPALTTTDTAAGPLGSYVIHAGLGTLASANYSFTLVSGTLTVSPAPTATTLAASSVSVARGQAVTLAATVTAMAPSGATPSGGNVTFYDNGTVLGSASVSGGLAALVTTSLGLARTRSPPATAAMASTSWEVSIARSS